METTRQPDVTRSRLLEAAFGEIHRQGFQAASVAGILSSTGLTKGALYHHFPNKQALGLAVVDEVIYGRVHDLYVEPLRRSPEPVETLLAILEKAPERGVELLPLGCPLNNLMQEMSPIDSEFQAHLERVLDAWIEAVADALRRGRQQGRVREEVACDTAALFIVSAWEGCIGIAKNRQSAETLSVCARQLQHYIRSFAPN